MSTPGYLTELKLEGAKAHIAQDPGDGSWLWSVTWPGRRAYLKPGKTGGEDIVQAVPKRHRSGKAKSYGEAVDAALNAHSLGRPQQ